MKRDFSKYKPTEYEKYRALRSNNRLVTFDQITHFAQFSSSDKTVTIHAFLVQYRSKENGALL